MLYFYVSIQTIQFRFVFLNTKVCSSRKLFVIKTVYTCCVFSLVALSMIGCAKEEQQKPSNTGTTYTNGGNNNSNGNNTNNSSGKPIKNSTLPVNHPVGSAAACGGCHKGFLKVPDWAIDGIAKEEEDMLKAETTTLQEQKSE